MANPRSLAAFLPSWVADAGRTGAELLSPSRRRDRARARIRLNDTISLATAISPTGTVLAGIFEGLRLPVDASWAGMSAYLAGTYEEELVPSLRRLIAASPSLVIDVGCAEGYYAIGLARLLPETPIHAYDIDPYARRVCRRARDLNAADNVTIHGRIKPSDLERRLCPGALVICDCEGYEVELLDLSAVPGLAAASLIVETHDFVDPTISATLGERFAATHHVETVSAQVRCPEVPQLAHLNPQARAAAIDEGRPNEPWPMRWLILEPR